MYLIMGRYEESGLGNAQGGPGASREDTFIFRKGLGLKVISPGGRPCWGASNFETAGCGRIGSLEASPAAGPLDVGGGEGEGGGGKGGEGCNRVKRWGGGGEGRVSWGGVGRGRWGRRGRELTGERRRGKDLGM